MTACLKEVCEMTAFLKILSKGVLFFIYYFSSSCAHKIFSRVSGQRIPFQRMLKAPLHYNRIVHICWKVNLNSVKMYGNHFILYKGSDLKENIYLKNLYIFPVVK